MIRHMVKGSLPLVLVGALVSCSGDPTGDLRNGTDHLTASPSSLFVRSDSTKGVIIGAVDEQGNQLSGDFKLGAVTGPFTVAFDSTYAPVYGGNGQLDPQKNPTSVRYIVTPTANTGVGTFTVTTKGKEIMIPIRIKPNFGLTTLSNASPALGDTVTATLGPNLEFTDSSAVTVAHGVTARGFNISPDNKTIQFLVGPGAQNDTVSFSNVKLTYAPEIGAFVGKTVVNTGPFPQINGFSTTTPQINQNVTITAPAGVRFPPETRVYFGTDRQVTVSIAADSNSLVYRPHNSGLSGPIALTNILVSQIPTLPLRIVAAVTNTVDTLVTSLAGTNTIATAAPMVIPDAGETAGINDIGPTFANAGCAAVGNHCRFYQFTITEDRTLTFTFNWGNTADIGGYFLDAAGNVAVGGTDCDAKGSGAAGQPETCTETFTAGTYYVALADFTGTAQNTSWFIKIEDGE